MRCRSRALGLYDDGSGHLYVYMSSEKRGVDDLVVKEEYPRCPKTPDAVAVGSVAEVKESVALEAAVGALLLDTERDGEGVVVYPEFLACGLTAEELDEFERNASSHHYSHGECMD